MTTRRAVLLGLAASTLPSAFPNPAVARPAEAGIAYAAMRIVRATPGTPETPEIRLPDGYALTQGSRYAATSRSEYVAFIQGPPDDGGVRVTVRWPGQPISAVVADDRCQPMAAAEGDPDAIVVSVPIRRPSPVDDSPTLQVWTRLSPIESGVNWLVAHNDPDRATGPWAATAFPTNEARAAITFTAAANTILRDAGLAAAAAARGHFFQLEGFETNNPLHADNPPHWHLSYFPGPTTQAKPATIPHYWLDPGGRTFYNGQDVTSHPRARYHEGDPAPIHDAAGTLVLTTRIRPDGGLDVQVPSGPAYAITSSSGAYTDRVTILRNGAPWRTVVTEDRCADGILRIDTGAERTEYEYDSLTGALIQQRPF